MRLTLTDNPLPRILALVAVLACGALLLACTAAETTAAPSDGDGDDAEMVAKINGKPIPMSDLEELARPQLQQLEKQRQQILEQTLNTLIEQKLLETEAESRDLTLEELLKAEIDDKAGEVTEAEVDAWYEENKERVRQPKEAVADRIKQFLENQRRAPLRNVLVSSLREKYEVAILMEPDRAEVEVAGAPTKGPDDAPVTIIEFSDFECPFCSRVNPTLAQVEEAYGDQVRIAFRQFPLPIHANAQKAAEASLCANDQDKFWEMHDKMFADQQNLGVDSLKKMAADVGLEAEQFNQCLDSDKYAQTVKDDLADGQAAGVSGTPALFVNGRLISGAVPFDQIAVVIDDELARAGSSGAEAE